MPYPAVVAFYGIRFSFALNVKIIFQYFFITFPTIRTIKRHLCFF